MKGQGWKNIVVVEERGGENVRWWCDKWWRLEGYLSRFYNSRVYLNSFCL